MPNTNIQPLTGGLFYGITTARSPSTGSLTLTPINAVIFGVLSPVRQSLNIVGAQPQLSYSVAPNISIQPLTGGLFYGITTARSPSTGSLTLTPSSAVTNSIVPTTGSLILVGTSKVGNTDIQPGTVKLRFGKIVGSPAIIVSAGNLSVSGTIPISPVYSSPLVGALNLVGGQCGAVQSLLVTPTVGILNTQSVAPVTGIGIVPSTGSLLVTGVSVVFSRYVVPSAGALSFVGTQSLVNDVRITTGTGETYLGLGLPGSQSVLVNTGSVVLSSKPPSALAIFAIPGTVRLRFGTYIPVPSVVVSTGALGIVGAVSFVGKNVTPNVGTITFAGNQCVVSNNVIPVAGTLFAQSSQQVVGGQIVAAVGTLISSNVSPNISRSIAPLAGALNAAGIGVMMPFPLRAITYDLSMIGIPSSISIDSKLVPSSGAISIVGTVPSTIATTATPATGVLGAVSIQPIILRGVALIAQRGILSVGGILTQVSRSITPQTGSLLASTYVSNVSGSITLLTGSLSGGAGLVNVSRSITPLVGGLSALTVSLKIDRGMLPTVGSLALTGVSISISRSISPNVGSLLLSGSASLTGIQSIVPNTGVLTVIGGLPITARIYPLEMALSVAGALAGVIQSAVVVPLAGILGILGYLLGASYSITPATGQASSASDASSLSRGLTPVSGVVVTAATAPNVSNSITPRAGGLLAQGRQSQIAGTLTLGTGALSLGENQGLVGIGVLTNSGALPLSGMQPVLDKGIKVRAGQLGIVNVHAVYHPSIVLTVASGSFSISGSIGPDILKRIVPSDEFRVLKLNLQNTRVLSISSSEEGVLYFRRAA